SSSTSTLAVAAPTIQPLPTAAPVASQYPRGPVDPLWARAARPPSLRQLVEADVELLDGLADGGDELAGCRRPVATDGQLEVEAAQQADGVVPGGGLLRVELGRLPRRVPRRAGQAGQPVPQLRHPQRLEA